MATAARLTSPQANSEEQIMVLINIVFMVLVLSLFLGLYFPFYPDKQRTGSKPIIGLEKFQTRTPRIHTKRRS
jgi:hypothetical protein